MSFKLRYQGLGFLDVTILDAIIDLLGDLVHSFVRDSNLVKIWLMVRVTL